ncbi:hypothetical protein L218DRAFT_877583 [Marasmius fiardii PR-910]|nr:hypothetical protein L218DRAFT_877583 [Marasmius fiardii PR-910]
MFQNHQSQLEELQLITCSLLPGELFTFSEHCEAQWSELLSTYIQDPDHIDSNSLSSLPPACFHVSLETWNIWFQVELPPRYPEDGVRPIITVKGENISRKEQETWNSVVEEKVDEVLEDGSGYPVYELLCSHLMPMLHEHAEAEVEKFRTATSATGETTSLESQDVVGTSSARQYQELYHALFTSHHLVSPTKRRNLQNWSSSLSLSGFAKVGYPGIIYAEGEKENIEEFVGNVKGMQWLALRLRFLEPLGDVESEDGPGKEKRQHTKNDRSHDLERRWGEFTKIGEVMEEMRRIGRERYLVEMGIGSSSSGSTR